MALQKYIRLDDALCAYVRDHRSDRTDPVWRDLREATIRLGAVAEMMIPEEEAALLSVLVGALRVRRAIEIGTFTGASGLAIARGLAEGGTLISLDKNEEWTRIAQDFWRRAGVADRIDFRLGAALASLESLAEEPIFDFAFVDADKTGYDSYYERLLPRMRTGGVLLFDNMLREGRVLESDLPDDPDTASIRRLNEKLREDSRIEGVLLPIADGIYFCRKR
ncbi:caffeoyl-CoA O-methyltransferase [Methylacidimicrobium cyclopophantes]|uniref:Caffeoyl-CoA O-methyltransferase n=1 Tax=Methylacidimicrobium cyclopophantes TaxID=1041766 RepID=A0A5E6MD62_9BACT|nr:class I SAM-dependent methyltransferase [Methylacidimicrobium cyclopophantes]VVM06900.1 caffeoyl-CoA O-methyltransferase [Methylacidimicrobium cyclopophantes]